MTRARDLANLGTNSTTVATTTDVANLQIEDIMDSK
jgi:hypothetical protein